MKNVLKKVGIWILIVCMLTMQTPLAYARESYSEPMLCVIEAVAEAGDTIDVSVVMYDNPGIVSMQLDIGYDSSVLTLARVTDGGLIGSAVHSNNLTLCPYRLTWANDLATTNYTENGTIVTLTFTIAENAAVGEYPITINYTKNNFEIFDCDANEVDFATVPGSITIAEKQCSHTTKTEVPSKSADCVNSGNNLYYVCGSCGLAFKADGVTETTVEAETIAALGHDLTDTTCTEAAMCQRKVCGYVEGSALGHSFTHYVSNNDANCTADGTKTAKCDRCNVTDTIADAGSAKGHDYADATCTTPKTCKVCGVIEGDPQGHNYASAWSKGENGHWHECSACGDKTDSAAHDYGDQGDKCVICEYERAHVHRLSLVPAVDATCTEAGNKAYYTCSGCENWFEDASGSVMISEKTSVIIGARGHDLSDASCTEPAKCQHEGCGHVEGEALGHSFTNYVSNNDATCTEDGTKNAKCDRCDVTDTITDAGSTKGHDYADATCTTPNTCKVCGVTEGDALGHRFTNYVSNDDATCTEEGTKTAKCDRCDVTDTITDVGSAKGHDYADAICTVPKTCNVCGATEGNPLGHRYATTWSKGEDGHWHECGTCGDKTDFAAHDFGSDGDKCIVCEYERTHIHRLTLTSAVDATCTTDGNVAYYTCSGCENWFEDAAGSIVISDKVSVVIAALGHDMTDASCTEASSCKREGCEYTAGSALGHSFANYVPNNNVTCTEDGTKTAKCDRCGVTDTITDVGSAKGHDYADAECTNPKTCKVCGVTEGDPLGHSYATTWSKGEDGHWHECSACGHKTDFTAHDYGTDGDICLICEYEYAHVHELTLIPSVDAACTTGGNVAYYTCSGCENWFKDASGTIVITDKTTTIISALGHDIAKANCLEVARCQRQNCDYIEGTALGHVDENADKKCDRCSMSLGTEQPSDTNKPSVDNPQTGDSFSLELWITLMILSFACAIVCICCGKKRNVA